MSSQTHKSQPGAGIALGGDEGLENAPAHMLGNSAAGVSNHYTHPAPAKDCASS